MDGSEMRDWDLNRDFADILLPRRGTSDVMWASRKWKPAIAHEQLVQLGGDEIKSIVFNSPHLKHIINKLNTELNVPVNQLYENAKDILKEIGFYRQTSVIRWLGVFIAKSLKKLYSRVFVNETQFFKFKSQMGKNPVLIVPTHRSYCDFVLMAYICFHYDVDIPRIAAGMDFASMAVIGNMLREACAFFIRRSFNNDELYSTIFSQFVETLVVNGDAAIEFFIEGTRSRTGKCLAPKYGFLSMALKSFFIGLVPDILILPVNLSYERIFEEVLFAFELLGVPKPKESTKSFIKALNILKENYGNAYVNFGNAISIKDYFGDKINRSVHNTGPIHLQELTAAETKQIVKLAHTIIRKQRELTVINVFNLIALILNNNIKTSGDPVEINKLTEEVKWLFETVKVLVPKQTVLAINGITKDVVLYYLSLHKSLISVTSGGKIHLERMFLENFNIDQRQLKGHSLLHNTLVIAIPLIMLQNYVNPCSYFLVSVCFIALIINSVSIDYVMTKDFLFTEFQFLCSVFSFEFVFHNDYIKKDFDNAFEKSQYLKVIEVENDSIKKGENEKLFIMLVNFLSSFIPAYNVVTEILLESAGGNVVEHELTKLFQQRIEAQLSGEMITHPSNLSLDILKNAMQSFISMSAVFKVKGDVLRYSVNRAKLKNIQLKLRCFDFRIKSDSDFLKQFSKFIKSSL